MHWIDQIPTEAWGAIGTLLTGLATAVGFFLREWSKRRAAETKLLLQRAELEIKEREADTVNFTTVVKLLSQTLTEFKETNERFVARLDSLAKTAQKNAEATRMIAESNQVMLELTKQGNEAAGREAVRITSTVREAHAETRAYGKQQTDNLAVAIEQLRGELAAAGLHSLKSDIDELLTKIVTASKIRDDGAHAIGEQTTDPSVAKTKDGDGMASASVPKPAIPLSKKEEAGQESSTRDS